MLYLALSTGSLSAPTFVLPFYSQVCVNHHHQTRLLLCVKTCQRAFLALSELALLFTFQPHGCLLEVKARFLKSFFFLISSVECCFILRPAEVHVTEGRAATQTAELSEQTTSTLTVVLFWSCFLLFSFSLLLSSPHAPPLHPALPHTDTDS